MNSQLDRRDILRLFTASVLAAPLQLVAASPGRPLFFSEHEFLLLDTLSELIVPRDSHSPGAHDAGVAAFIDRSVAEAFLPEEKEAWKKGLAEVDRLSMETDKKPFVENGKSAQIALLEKLAQAEEGAKGEEQRFFGRLKGATVFAYYTSDIGIHQDIGYIGNVVQEQFSGYEAV